MLQRDESALVPAGMSMLWAPENLWEAPAYDYQGREHDLLNVLDDTVEGEMTVKDLPYDELP
ncbi:hypothetical protein Hanom_Chr03g00193631 [Helianthus anomalus]